MYLFCFASCFSFFVSFCFSASCFYFLICFLLIFLRMLNKLICTSKKQGGDTLTKYKKIDCPLFVKNIENCSVRISCKCVIINFECIILEIKNFKIKSYIYFKSTRKISIVLKLTNLLIFGKIMFFKGKKMVTIKKENDNFFLLFYYDNC